MLCAHLFLAAVRCPIASPTQTIASPRCRASRFFQPCDLLFSVAIFCICYDSALFVPKTKQCRFCSHFRAVKLHLLSTMRHSLNAPSKSSTDFPKFVVITCGVHPYLGKITSCEEYTFRVSKCTLWSVFFTISVGGGVMERDSSTIDLQFLLLLFKEIELSTY